MDWQRYLLLGGIGIIVVLLFQRWNTFEEQHKPVVDNRTVVESVNSGTPVVPQQSPSVADDEIPTVGAEQVAPQQTVVNSNQLISIETDVLQVLINPHGGDIVKVALPEYLQELEGREPTILLNNTSTTTYIAQSGLTGVNGTDKNGTRPQFSSTAYEYQLSGDTLSVDLNYQQGEVNITKRFYRPSRRLSDGYRLPDR